MTTVALPAIWLFARGESSSGTAAPGVAAVGVAAPEIGAATTPDVDVDPLGTDGPIFVDGPTTPPKPAIVPVAVPAMPLGGYVDGSATYKRNPDPNATGCSAPTAPFNATLTITNLDNGRIVTCVNRTPRALPAEFAIELTASQFETIAQLVDAPVPVRVQWTTG